jgi:hypothetical protein
MKKMCIEEAPQMKSWFKLIAGLLIVLAVVGAITMLAIRYFDVLVRGFESIRDTIHRKKARFFSGDCCDYDEDDEDDLLEAEEV